MPPQKRRVSPGVAQRLLDEPQRFEFFQAIRVLEHLFVRNGSRPQDVLTRRLRFRSSLNMAFPASAIEQLRAYTNDDTPIGDTGSDLADAWDTLSEVDITPAFMGMLGSQGVLPYHYTERLSARESEYRDHAARAFLDIFNNRAVAMFYAAWKKYRPAFQYELNRREHFLPMVLSIAGMGLPSLRDKLQHGKGALFDQALAHYAAGIGQRPMSAVFLQQTLCEYFETDIRVEQFAGAWYMIPASQHARLGSPNAALGKTAMAGERVWQRNLRVRLWIGPLRRNRFKDFLPGGAAAEALAKWLSLLSGNTLEYEIQLVMHKDDVRPTGLDGDNGGRLGWDTMICTQPANDHRADTNYLIQTLA